MTKKANKKAAAKPASITGDHFTLAQVAIECSHFQTEMEAVNEKKGSISDHFMNAATMYITEAPQGEMQKDHPFLVACKAQEELSKSNEAGVNKWDKIPSSWSQMKSNIKAAYNRGIDINSFETESMMRAELNSQRKAEKDELQANTQVDEALTDVAESLSPEISLRLFAFVNACKDLTEAQELDAVRILDESLENLITMKEISAQFAGESGAA